MHISSMITLLYKGLHQVDDALPCEVDSLVMPRCEALHSPD